MKDGVNLHLFMYNKHMITFRIKLVNIVLEVNAFYELTKEYCKDYLTNEEPDYAITMSKEDLENESSNSIEGHVYVSEEISALYRKIADLFVDNNIVVFHGSSFKVGNYAYIVTAKSGTGKSTHVKLLETLLGNEFSYINDDKPLLEVNDDVTLYSSPWNGKERRGNCVHAPLKSVIFLNRGETNTYKKLDNSEEVYFRLLSQIYLPKQKDKREKALKLIDILLGSVSFYEINVNMNISAAKMTYERIIKDEIK